MDSSQANFQPTPGKRVDLELTKDGYKIRRVCEDRFTPVDGTKDITQTFYSYLPFDDFNTETYVALNMVGMNLGDIEIRSRTVYPSYDGKRLVLEVGCNTVIFIQISPNNKAIHHHLFIESHKDFLMDITTRAVAARVSHVAQPMVTIGRYEMFFILGMLSTVSIAMWLMITGSDITVTAVSLRHKTHEFGKLAKSLLKEMANIKKYAPTLHKKLMQLIIAERNKLALHTAEKLPKTIATDEKAQAKTAGILYGKSVLSPKLLNVWGALLTVLIQVGIKSVTDSPAAARKAIDERYAPIIRGFANTDWRNINERKLAVARLVKIMKEDKLSITKEEAEQIVKEILAHPKKLESSLINIVGAIKTYQAHVR